MPLDTAPGRAPYEKMSSTMLAMQPLTPKVPYPDETRYWSDIYSHLERRMAGMRSWRWTWFDQWRELAAFFLPRRIKPWFPIANDYTRGAYLNNNIIDSTGVLAMNTCASGMWSGLTNPSRVWFAFGPALDDTQVDQDGKEWLDELQVLVAAILHQSNFYSTMAQFFQDVTVFGTSPLIIYEDREEVIRCYLPCVGEYFLGTGARLTVDTLYREYTQTVLQITEMFGTNNCPPAVWEAFSQGGAQMDREFIVAHAIEPNFAVAGPFGRRTQILPERFTFREVYWLRGMKGQKPLSVRGFYEKPFMAGRWYLTSNDPYGRSPCMDALGDNKQIQQETIRKAEYLEKGVRPPMVASPEMKNEPASIMPGMVTFVNTANGTAGFKPAFEVVPQWLQYITADIKDVQARIKEVLYVPQFMAITQMQGVQPRNELELTKRDLERLQMLGPVIDLFENEVAGPALQRVVSIAQRRGMIRPMPESLARTPLKITYQSLLRMAQQSAEAVSLKDFIAAAGVASTAAQAARLPDPLRTVNLEEWIRRYGRATHVPSDLMFTPAQVRDNDAKQAKAMQDAKNAEIAPQATKETVAAAKSLSETQLNNGSVLDALVGPGGYPGSM